MFVVMLEYVRPLREVERFIGEHREFLRANYDAGRFIASGPRVPRTGGVILARGGDRVELEQILENDPFKREGVAAYTVLEFNPTMADPGFAPFVEGI